jgi:signal transduction histidine kinase
MGMKGINRMWKMLESVVTPISKKKQQGVRYIRERIFHELSFSVVYLGIFVLLISEYASFKAKLYPVALIDLVFYLLLLVAATSRRMSFIYRVLLMLVVFYLIGIGMLVLLGPFGAGWLWLFAFVCSTSLLLEFRYSMMALGLSVVTTVLLGFFIASEIQITPYFAQYNMAGWLAVSANFLALVVFVSVSFAVIVRNIEKNIDHLNFMKDSLQQNRVKLLALKDRAEESDRLKSLFLSNMSHEIRSPMNAILGFSSLLRNPDLSREKTNEYLTIINDRGEILMKLINDLLDISRIEANELKLVSEEFDVPDLLSSVWKVFKDNPHYSIKEIDFHLTLPDEQNHKIVADPVRVQQVITNLVHNSFKFTERGYVNIGYECRKDEFLFYVRDSGVGIEEEKVSLIFERFNQAEDFNQHSGTGLGLAISKALVEKMGGTIWVVSQVGKGSTFYFTLPRISLN